MEINVRRDFSELPSDMRAAISKDFRGWALSKHGNIGAFNPDSLFVANKYSISNPNDGGERNDIHRLFYNPRRYMEGANTVNYFELLGDAFFSSDTPSALNDFKLYVDNSIDRVDTIEDMVKRSDFTPDSIDMHDGWISYWHNNENNRLVAQYGARHIGIKNFDKEAPCRMINYDSEVGGRIFSLNEADIKKILDCGALNLDTGDRLVAIKAEHKLVAGMEMDLAKIKIYEMDATLLNNITVPLQMNWSRIVGHLFPKEVLADPFSEGPAGDKWQKLSEVARATGLSWD